MAVTLSNTQPVGGGLGNRKILLTQLSGTYASGGFELFTKQPVFAMTNKGFTVAYNPETGKTQIYTDGGSSGGQVVIPEQTISGVQFANGSEITGAVDGSTATIAVGDAKVAGSVVVPSQTVSVSGATYTAGSELAASTSVDGVSIFAIF